MRKAKTKSNFNPYRRYENAFRRFANKALTPSTDVWEDKIVDILQIRKVFQDKYSEDYLKFFEDKYPLYASLITAFEDDRTGGDRDLLEAVLLTSLNLSKVVSDWKHPRFNELFLSLYRTLFYNVTPILGNPSLEFQYIISPMIRSNSNKLAVGSIWKILAITGGISLLSRKGFSNEAIKAEDIEHLMQLAGFRHCSTLLQYTAEGKDFFADNPAAALAINSLTSFDGVRGHGRRADYLAELDTVAKNSFNDLLSGEFKLLSVADSDILKLVEYDGSFRPDITNTLEYVEHVTFIDGKADDNER